MSNDACRAGKKQLAALRGGVNDGARERGAPGTVDAWVSIGADLSWILERLDGAIPSQKMNHQGPLLAPDSTRGG